MDTKILHDPMYLVYWELWYYIILRSCRIFSINSSMQKEPIQLPVWGMARDFGFPETSREAFKKETPVMGTLSVAFRHLTRNAKPCRLYYIVVSISSALSQCKPNLLYPNMAITSGHALLPRLQSMWRGRTRCRCQHNTALSCLFALHFAGYPVLLIALHRNSCLRQKDTNPFVQLNAFVFMLEP